MRRDCSERLLQQRECFNLRNLQISQHQTAKGVSFTGRGKQSLAKTFQGKLRQQGRVNREHNESSFPGMCFPLVGGLAGSASKWDTFCILVLAQTWTQAKVQGPLGRREA